MLGAAAYKLEVNTLSLLCFTYRMKVGLDFLSFYQVIYRHSHFFLSATSSQYRIKTNCKRLL